MRAVQRAALSAIWASSEFCSELVKLEAEAWAADGANHCAQVRREEAAALESPVRQDRFARV
jgi:hypothetical protein